MYKKCNQCKKRFKTSDKRNKFCCLNCYHQSQKENPNKGTFRYRKEPVWNKGLKGIHLSKETEFKKGQRGINWKDIGSITTRKDKNKKIRKWIKVKEPNVWELLAVYNWKQKFGKIKKGLVIHHKDFNCLNDDTRNLIAISRKEHINIHR